ncbi:RNA-guided endonuclease InsQ/TnpB family protein [Streptomyces sp. RKAG337]|uniref:RNA-guided endonuclease InsQ/TnpB family protein n=1 Tax=Streptomyces sp. RKAG337 TaxID=2893404 RepID=UPI0020336518|nr:transposase [Streptomyces sp. RKAG337]
MAQVRNSAKTKRCQADEGRRYRLHPTHEQAGRLRGWGHSCRALWNLALEQRQYVYRQRGVTLRLATQGTHLTAARAELDWLKDLPAQAGQSVLRHLDAAYENWWNRDHPSGAPVFKKRSGKLSVPLPGQAVRVEKLSRRWASVTLPKIGPVRFRLTRALGGEVKNATVVLERSGRWYVSFGVATGRKPGAPNGKPGCGVDFGVVQAAYVSDESSPRVMPKTLSDGEERRLLGLQRRQVRQITFAKKHNGGRYGNRLRRTTRQIAEVKARQARRRHDFTHKLTSDLAKNHGMVAIEDLRVINMTAGAHGSVEEPGTRVAQKAAVNRGILDNMPGERRRQLEYKSSWYGSCLVAVNPAGYSQTCAECGHRDAASRISRDRFECRGCGHRDDADRSASRILHRRGTHLLATQDLFTAAGPAVDCTRRPSSDGPSPRSSGRRMREPLNPSPVKAV